MAFESSEVPTEVSFGSSNKSSLTVPPHLVTLCYRGVEVIVVKAPEEEHILLLICTRTRQIFGRLKVPEKIIGIHANNHTGLILVSTASDEVYSFYPTPSDKVFGRYKWVRGITIDYFSALNDESIDKDDNCIGSISSSCCWKVLVSFGNLLALFDGRPPVEAEEQKKGKKRKNDDNSNWKLIWTTNVPSEIQQAEISGNGEALAFILYDNDAVYTFEESAIGDKQASRDAGGNNVVSTITSAVGEGRFTSGSILPHPYPITRISWRGRGFDYNDDNPDIEPISTGNDLLLTVCEDDASSHIFSQNGWTEVVSWMGAAGSRTSWIQAASIANLGDLDEKFVEKTTASRMDSSSRGSDSASNSNSRTKQQSGAIPGIQKNGGLGIAPGVWVAELTFRGHFPALRLSNLSFGKDGKASELIEGPATLLPVGSLVSKSLLENDCESSFWVQGIWSSWYNKDDIPREENQDIVFLPPAEVRIVAGQTDRTLSLLHLPLCMDGGIPDSAEFGRVLKYELNVRSMHLPPSNPIPAATNKLRYSSSACMDYVSSKICAKVDSSVNARVISITWIQEGAMFVCSEKVGSNEYGSTQLVLDDEFDPCFGINPLDLQRPQQLVDCSVMPLPIVLPSLRVGSRGDETIASLHWWPNENFGGVPRLLVIMTSGTISLYEIPPPWKATEPPVSAYDPLGAQSQGFQSMGSLGSASAGQLYDSDDELSVDSESREYAVSLTPHPDFGIGLRLEAQENGLPAIVGSYKKHPLSGGRLPAEKIGMIMVGDELIAVNEETLCNMSFEEIIAAVRRVGANTNEPLRMRFKSRMKEQRIVDLDGSRHSLGSAASRRTVEDIIGIRKKEKEMTDDPSVATGVFVLDSADWNPDEEWVKTISKLRGAFSEISPISCASVLPMHYGAGAPNKSTSTSAALIVACGGRKMIAVRLEVDEKYPEGSVFVELGSTEIELESDIQQVSPVKTATPGWCLAVGDANGNVLLVFVDTDEKEEKLSASFRQYPIFKLGTGVSNDHIIRAASVNYIAAARRGNKGEVTVWYSAPAPKSTHCVFHNYSPSTISIDNCDQILDIRWITSGYLDAHPWLVTFSERSAVVNYRPGGSAKWIAIAELPYPLPEAAKYAGEISPADAYPHLIPALRSMLNINDEISYLRSDWDVDSILATICTDKRGAETALTEKARKIYSWLSRWQHPDKSMHPVFVPHCALSVIPLSKLEAENDTFDSKESLLSNSPANGTQTLLMNLQKALLARRENMDKENHVTNGKSTLPSLKRYTENRDIPLPIYDASKEDIDILWAIGEAIANPPEVSKVDAPGQLFLFSKSLYSNLRTKGSNARSNASNKNTESIAGAAALGALLSSSQHDLLNICRGDGLNSWEEVRGLLLPLWLRDDKELRKITEDLAKEMFRSTKKIMDCMIFFVMLQKKALFLNFAKTDQSAEGRKLATFLSTFDFSSDRGRKAAEKNAFSLLRKRRYSQAAAFFLLAEPPMITSALNVILMQMDDVSLALLVSRLVEVDKDAMNDVAFGSASSFMRSIGSAVTGTKKSDFSNWKPKLGDVSTRLLGERAVISDVPEDCSVEIILLFWLGKNVDAVYCLAGENNEIYESPVAFNKEYDSCNGSAALEKTNTLMNFTSKSFLLHQIKTGKRLRWRSALLLSRALRRRGLELAAMQTLLEHTKEETEDGEEDIHLIPTSDSETVPRSSFEGGNLQQAKSSIFDSFDVPPPKANKKTIPYGGSGMNSSIFDSFDAAPPVKKKPASDPSATNSSIFDSFDTAPPVKNPASSNSAMTSSIFDTFDVPTPKKPVPPPPVTANMESLIFDSFSAPPQKSKPTETPYIQSGEISSSIFDSFDAPIPSKNVSNQESGTGSIFDASDALKSTKVAPKVEDVPSLHENENHSYDEHVPCLWNEWKELQLADTVARRILREIGFIVSRMEGDLPASPLSCWGSLDHHSILHDAAQLIQHNCEGNVLEHLEGSLKDMCQEHKIEVDAVIEKALVLLGCPNVTRRIVFAVLLYCLMGRNNLVDVLVRNAAQNQIRRCCAFALGNDGLSIDRNSKFFASSLLVRRHAACVSWQLELCLWLRRGGLFTLSTAVEKEAIVAVRVGLLISSWGRSFYDLEQMIKCEPDCPLDLGAGQEIWRSMKSSGLPKRESASGVHSGGWEFLVDCTRNEASEMLQSRKPGSFLLRPHPEDSSIFTLSFKSNATNPANEVVDAAVGKSSGDTVQHAIVRLSDLGFRCGSFGPFPTLIKLLNAVSESLPYGLLLNEPPVQGVIQNEGKHPSPNSVLIRKLTLHARPEQFTWNNTADAFAKKKDSKVFIDDDIDYKTKVRYGALASLLALTGVTKHLCGVVAAESDDLKDDEIPAWQDNENDPAGGVLSNQEKKEDENDLPGDVYLLDGCGSLADSVNEEDQVLDEGTRILRPLFEWRRSLEMQLVPYIAPNLCDEKISTLTCEDSEGGSSVSVQDDAIIRHIIRPGSGVEVRTLRIGEGGHSAVVVLFSQAEAIPWLVSTGIVADKESAIARLKMMSQDRIVEEICLKELAALSQGKKLTGKDRDIRYRFIDPWEIQTYESSRVSDMDGASLGRERYVRLHMSDLARSSEDVQNANGGLALLSIWSMMEGGEVLNAVISSVLPPWERDTNGDCGRSGESMSYLNSIRRYLYRNSLYRRFHLPQRFVAVVKVEILDLKNLTSPGGTPSLTAYALLRLKRPGRSAPLTHKVRTLDSASTSPKKIDRSSGPNPSASWKSMIRFRFPLPEDVDTFGMCPNKDREALFPGPPSVLQLTVYEKKFITDNRLGSADVKLDALADGGHMEEWVPLRAGKDGVVWFARLRISLKFKLMCLAHHAASVTDKTEDEEEESPSVGLTKIKMLSQHGAYEDLQGNSSSIRKSVSTPDLLSYLESVVS